ncbi:class I SAM-dependent methyltransferase [Candidatus Daviesbacteria bacterium]|nr:class I SAM-dependent methyltransferase [Candidatus Daviesbacteria bacterium]
MNNYIKHLQELSSAQTLIRKKEYIDYNLNRYFKEIGFRNLKVLEVGPGLGEFESYLNEKEVEDIDLVDNDKQVLNYVSKKYKVNKIFLAKSIVQLHKHLQKYNFIFMMQVLEHLPINQHKTIFKILYNHLKQNGYFVIVVPNGNNPLGLVERYADLQHTTCFTEQSLKDLVNLSGIRGYQIGIKGYEIPSYNIINILRIVLQKLLHAILLLILIINGGVYFKIMTPNIMMIIRKNR